MQGTASVPSADSAPVTGTAPSAGRIPAAATVCAAFRLLMPDQDRHHPVVSKFVLQLPVQGDAGRILRRFLNLRLGITLRSQIELVAFIGELGDPGHIQRLKRPDHRLHLQRFQIGSVIREAGLLRRPLRVGLIHLIPLPVILGERSHLKIAVVIQNTDVLLRRTDLRHGNAFRMGAHNFPFRRVIIHKHQTFRQNIHFLRYCQNILTFRFPVRFYQNKIIRPQHAVRMIQPGQRIFFLILGIHIQHDADVLQRFHIGLEFRIHLSHGGFLADLQIFHTVISHNTAPERIVQIQHQRLFVLSIDGLDDVGNVQRQPRDCLQTQGILVHMPVEGVGPGVQPVSRSLIIDIINIKILRTAGIFRKPLIHPPHKSGPASRIYPVLISQEPVKGILHIVLDDGTIPLFPDFFPHHLKMSELLFKRRIRRGTVPAGRGPVRDVAVAGVDINDVRMEGVQLLISKHGVLPVLAVFRLVENGLNSLIQQKKLQNPDHVMSGAPPKNGDSLLHAGRAVREKLLFYMF